MSGGLEVRVSVDRPRLLGRVWCRVLLMAPCLLQAWHESETKKERAEACTAFCSGFGQLTRK